MLLMKHLPYDLNRYFKKNAGTIEVPLSDLIPSDPHASQKANEFMFAAYMHGKQRRAPLTVARNGMGKYVVLDGNSTLRNAAAYNWPNIYVDVKPFSVVAGTLFDQDHYEYVESFDTRWEAEKFVDENDDKWSESCYALFIEGDND